MSRKNTGGQNVLEQIQWMSQSRLPLLHSSQAQILRVCVTEEGRQAQVHPENTECCLRNKYWSFPFFTQQCVPTIHIFFSPGQLPRRGKLIERVLPSYPGGVVLKKSSASFNGQICLMYFTVYIINVLPEKQNFEFHKGSGNIFVLKYERETDIHNYQLALTYTLTGKEYNVLNKDTLSLN